jgi:hypothetical protein
MNKPCISGRELNIFLLKKKIGRVFQVHLRKELGRNERLLNVDLIRIEHCSKKVDASPVFRIVSLNCLSPLL